MNIRQKVEIDGNEGRLISELFKQPVPSDVWVLENKKNIVHMHSYGGLSRFFYYLSEEMLLGTYCRHCAFETRLSPHDRVAEVWLPPRVHCPDCWNKMAWCEVNTENARVYSFSVTNFPGAGFRGTVPCSLISLEIPGVCTNMMSYLSEFGEGEPYIGMPVRPVFRTKNPTRTILDLSWVPVD